MPAMEIPYAEAVVFTTGGRRPKPGREGNWINHAACRLPDEPLPADADGNSMLPLAMFTRSFLPWMPPVLDGTEVLAVFISMALFEHLNDDDWSGWFCVREYPADAVLEPCDWTPPGAKPFVLTPEIIYESETSFGLEKEEASCGHKLGGYPTFIQGEVEFEGHEFAFQISSDSKAGLNIVDQGSFYFFKTASPAHGKPGVTFSERGKQNMLLAKNQIRKILLLRPGALGDVLAVRPVIRFFREAFPAAEICLAAPGSRGEFFRRDGWAHRTYDWDRAPFAWLFAGGDTPPPPQLSAVFAGSDIIIAYLDFSDHAAMHAFEHALERAAPAAGKVYCPARPPAGHALPIGKWLLQAAAAFCSRYGLLQECDTDAAYTRLIAETIPVSAPARIPGLKPPYLAVHPGSGSRSKSWPAEYFAVLVRHLLQEENASGKIFAGAAVTSGEADGDAGARLAAAVPGAVHFSMPPLEDLAGLLAHAALYIGNDSGVSHLAAAVSPSGGVRAPAAVFFGPSDPAVWAPPGALVLPAGRPMDAMVPEEALRRIRGHYTGIFQKDLTSQPDYAE